MEVPPHPYFHQFRAGRHLPAPPRLHWAQLVSSGLCPKTPNPTYAQGSRAQCRKYTHGAHVNREAHSLWLRLPPQAREKRLPQSDR